MNPNLLFLAWLLPHPQPAAQAVDFGKAGHDAVTAVLVCTVQNAIRWREGAWSKATCERLAAAFNHAPNPLLTMAIAINESDLRPRVISAEARPGKRPGRNVHGKSRSTRVYRAWPESARAYDIGLMGIRCITSDRCKCLNGHARGFTVARLQEPTTNIAVGTAILATKRSLQRYNGGTHEHGYAARIGAIMAALQGVEVKVKGKRIRNLVAKIAEAVAREIMIDTQARAMPIG